MIDIKKIDIHDIYQSKELGKGFLIFQNDKGYFIGFMQNGELQTVQQIDRMAYNTIERSGGGRKK